VFRQARLIPAVEYLQANRVRTLVMEAMARVMDEIDVFVAEGEEGEARRFPRGAGGSANKE